MLDSANEKKLQWGIQFHQMKDFKAGKLESPEIIFKHTIGNLIHVYHLHYNLTSFNTF